jgi:hypothetical protein
MLNILTPFALAFVALYLGYLGFTPQGLPWSKEKRLVGRTGRVVGTICLIFGGAMLLFGIGVILQITGVIGRG